MKTPAPRGIALAVDIGGTKVETGLVDASGSVIAGSAARRPTGQEITAAALLAAIEQSAAQTLAAAPDGAALVGVGIGSAGPVDLASDTIAPLNMPRARGARPRDALLGLAPDVPVRLALDGTCIALAEHRWGAGRGARSLLAMVVSTGVGGGFVVAGAPIAGSSGNAGHIGQIPARPQHDDDPRALTVEEVASGPRTVAWARSRGWRGESGEDLAAAWRAGDDIAREAVGRSATAVGEAIATASTLLDLDVAVVAGGFAAVAADYVDQVQRAVAACAPHAYAARVEVRPSGLAGRGPLLGAAALVLGPVMDAGSAA